jgi:hypothetical protein
VMLSQNLLEWKCHGRISTHMFNVPPLKPNTA